MGISPNFDCHADICISLVLACFPRPSYFSFKSISKPWNGAIPLLKCEHHHSYSYHPVDRGRVPLPFKKNRLQSHCQKNWRKLLHRIAHSSGFWAVRVADTYDFPCRDHSWLKLEPTVHRLLEHRDRSQCYFYSDPQQVREFIVSTPLPKDIALRDS